MLELRNVNYFFDGDNYYKKINNRTLKKISKEEFYKKSKYNPKTIDKLLYQSEYAGQINDYILLRIPKWLKIKLNLKKKYIPADYQLANLIKFLWKKKIIMFNWNQPKNKFGGIGSIQCENNTLSDKKVIDIIIELFGENNIIIYDYIKNPSLKEFKQGELVKKYPNKIVIFVFPEYIYIEFLQKKLEWIHKKLNIPIPKISDSSKGGIILSPDEISSCNII
jgi:hypothetical protein